MLRILIWYFYRQLLIFNFFVFFYCCRFKKKIDYSCATEDTYWQPWFGLWIFGLLRYRIYKGSRLLCLIKRYIIQYKWPMLGLHIFYQCPIKLYTCLSLVICIVWRHFLSSNLKKVKLVSRAQLFADEIWCVL